MVFLRSGLSGMEGDRGLSAGFGLKQGLSESWALRSNLQVPVFADGESSSSLKLVPSLQGGSLLGGGVQQAQMGGLGELRAELGQVRGAVEALEADRDNLRQAIRKLKVRFLRFPLGCPSSQS